MHLGLVMGSLVATVRADGLDGVKFLIVQPLDKRQQPKGEPVVAADAVAMAGTGELVYYIASREAAEAMPEPYVPVDHADSRSGRSGHSGRGRTVKGER